MSSIWCLGLCCCQSWSCIFIVCWWLRAMWYMVYEVTDNIIRSWWRHQMETFSALLVICAGNSPVTGEFHAHKGQWRGALMFSLICALNKRLSKQSRGWWFETPSCSLWRHCNASSKDMHAHDTECLIDPNIIGHFTYFSNFECQFIKGLNLHHCKGY